MLPVFVNHSVLFFGYLKMCDYTQKIRTKVRIFCLHLFCQCNLVEARGVEPLSESTFTGTSPSAGGRLPSLTQPQAVKLLSLVES